MKALLIPIISGMFFLIGTLISAIFKNKKEIINFSIGMSISVLLLLIILDLIPEAVELYSSYKVLLTVLGAIAGVLMLWLAEHLIPHNHTHSHIGLIAIIPIMIHDFIEGASIYSVASVSIKAGIIYALGVALHNLPLGIKISSTIKDEGKLKTWIHMIILSLSSFVGGLLMFMNTNFMSPNITAFILSVTTGMIAYIIYMEINDVLNKKINKNTIIGMITGVIIMIISQLI